MTLFNYKIIEAEKISLKDEFLYCVYLDSNNLQIAKIVKNENIIIHIKKENKYYLGENISYSYFYLAEYPLHRVHFKHEHYPIIKLKDITRQVKIYNLLENELS